MIKSIVFIISFLSLIYFFIAIQFVYAQIVENEIIENPLERVEKATVSNSEITESLNKSSESTADNTTTSYTSKQQNQSEFKIYENQNIGVKFKMPSTWEIGSEYNRTKDCFDKEVDKIFISSYHNCKVLLKNNASYPYDFNVGITKHSTSNYSLADFLTLVYQDIKHQEGFSFINDKEMTIQNNPAWQIEYSEMSQYIEYKEMDIFTKINNTFYSLTYYTTNSSVYSKYLPEFENFVKSIEFIPSIEPMPSFLKYSTLKNTINNNETIEQNQASKELVDIEQVEKESDYDSYAPPTTTTTSNNIITDLLFDKYYPIVKVGYESDSMVVLEGNENYLSEINGSFVPFWESIDIVKNQGYSLKEITTSLGTGNKDNPTIFYAIFFNNSNKIEK